MHQVMFEGRLVPLIAKDGLFYVIDKGLHVRVAINAKEAKRA